MRLSLSVLLALALSGPALASDPVLGVWKTEPDRKSLTSHIRIAPCGTRICGTVLKAFDATGKQITTPNVGKPLFWDIQPLGGGAYGNGTVYVPLLDVTAKASMTLSGNRLKVTGCKGPVCDGQTWTRVP